MFSYRHGNRGWGARKFRGPGRGRGRGRSFRPLKNRSPPRRVGGKKTTTMSVCGIGDSNALRVLNALITHRPPDLAFITLELNREHCFPGAHSSYVRQRTLACAPGAPPDLVFAPQNTIDSLTGHCSPAQGATNVCSALLGSTPNARIHTIVTWPSNTLERTADQQGPSTSYGVRLLATEHASLLRQYCDRWPTVRQLHCPQNDAYVGNAHLSQGALAFICIEIWELLRTLLPPEEE